MHGAAARLPVASNPDLSGSYTFISGLERDPDSLPVELQDFRVE
jgi:hypothetical protein